MTTKRGRGAGDVTPPGADDFGRIHGIGAAIKSRLYVAGIVTFAQLADLTPDEIVARIGDFPGKSAELIQEWIDQARALASTPAEPQGDAPNPAESQHDLMNSTIRLHPATFTLELQLHEDNTVHHTRVTHHQSEDKGSWASWEEARLVGFIVEHAGLRLPPAEPATLVAESVEPAGPIEPVPVLVAPVEAAPAPTEPAEPAEPAAPVAAQPVPAAPTEPAAPIATPVEPPLIAPAVPAEATSAAPAAPAKPAAPVVASPQLVMTTGPDAPHLRALEAVPADTDEPSHVLRHDQPFGVRLTFDLAGVAISGNTPLDYTAAIYAKSLSSRSHETLGEARGAIAPDDTIIVNVQGKALRPGAYRLEATVALTTPSTTPSRPGPVAMIESGLVQIY